MERNRQREQNRRLQRNRNLQRNVANPQNNFDQEVGNFSTRQLNQQNQTANFDDDFEVGAFGADLEAGLIDEFDQGQLEHNYEIQPANVPQKRNPKKRQDR